ncbi:MAG: radical SAM protein [Bacteriovoracaceae bacterium]|jgi:radical SAM superfamily enzyme YgiQ (UPF0313 family)|nr:radical SAM protein [Bacteriovoracaceae bacterium]
MKIAFLSINTEKLPDPVAPLGLYYIMGSISDEHDKELWDICFVEDYQKFLIHKIKSFSPDLIAISIRNIQNNDYSNTATNLKFYHKVMKLIKSQTNCQIVLGGSGFSVIPDQLMNELKPSYGIVREGEFAFPQLVDAIESKKQCVEHISNLFYFNDQKLVFTGFASNFLDISELMPEKKKHHASEYYNLTGIDSVQTKRGCPFHCSYCTYPQIEGKQYRTRNPVQVLKEMNTTLSDNPEVSHFFIVDSVFNHPINYAKNLCREMIAQSFDTDWTCYLSPFRLDAELVSLMSRAGCKGVELGSDSGHNKVLRDLKKGFTVDDIVHASKLCREFGISDCHTFVLGTSGETIDDVKETLDFLCELKPHSAILMVWSDDGLATSSLQPTNNLIFRHQILELLKLVCKDHSNWIVPEINVNFNPKMLNFLRRRGIRGPLWQQLDHSFWKKCSEEHQLLQIL